MADLWQQFHALPKAIRDGVATPAAIAAVDALERQYPGVELASFVMRAVVREFPITELGAKIASESSIDAPTAGTIAETLRREVFTGMVGDYLGMNQVQPSAPPSRPPKMQTAAVPMTRPPVNVPMVPPPVKAQPAVAIPKPVPIAKPVPRPATIQPAPMTSRPSVTPKLIVPLPTPLAPVGSSAPTTQYSDADAAEIAQQASKLRTLSNVNPNQDLESLARQILLDQNQASSDELLERRSISILKSRLKDLRSTAETVEMMTRDPKVGGLGLDREIALTLAASAEHTAATLKERGMVRPPEAPLPPTMPALPTVIQQKPTPMPPLHREAQPMSAVPVKNFTESARASRPIVRPADIPVMAPLPPPARQPRPKASPAPIIQRSRGTDRPTVADVVRPQVALGPAEELRSMTLIEFRRLGQGAGDAARRLLDKFQHLQRESFAVWAEAIAGWRQSSVYQLYLTMGRESMEKGQPISQIIVERGKTGQPYLSEHEFTVLSDLNRQLQF